MAFHACWAKKQMSDIDNIFAKKSLCAKIASVTQPIYPNRRVIEGSLQESVIFINFYLSEVYHEISRNHAEDDGRKITVCLK
jgi:hypothetical protein